MIFTKCRFTALLLVLPGIYAPLGTTQVTSPHPSSASNSSQEDRQYLSEFAKLYQRLTPEEKETKTGKLFKSLSGSCAPEIQGCSGHSSSEVFQTQLLVNLTLVGQSAFYVLASKSIRKELGVPLPQELQDVANPTRKKASFDHRLGGVNRQLVVFESKSSNDAIEILVQTCKNLEESLAPIGVSGLSAYVANIKTEISTDKQSNDSEHLAAALRKVDAMFLKLRQANRKLAVSPDIISPIPGVTVWIATQAEALADKPQFFGKTDVKTVNLFRGIYKYVAYAPGYRPYQASLDLINNPGEHIVCKPADADSISCIAQ